MAAMPHLVVPAGAATLAALHDVGKISPGFQRKCPQWLIEQSLAVAAQTAAWTRAEPDHSKVSQFTIQHVLREQTGSGKNDAAFWAAAIGMHHGAPHWRGEWKAAARSGIPADDAWEERRRKLAAELAATIGRLEPLPSVELEDFSRLWETAGLITVADWIGSDETFFSPIRAEIPAEPQTVRAFAKQALERIGMQPPRFTPGAFISAAFWIPSQRSAIGGPRGHPPAGRLCYRSADGLGED